MTASEKLLWNQIRLRQLNGFKFRRQQPIGRYIVDFVCLEKGLVVELDGGQHAWQEEEDIERTTWLESQGFRLIRFWNHQIMKNLEEVKQEICKELEGENSPRPIPPPQVGRVK